MKIVESLPKRSIVLLAIGEIDCRLDDGIIPYTVKNPDKDVKDIVQTTVENYLGFISQIESKYNHSFIIQGVPCPNIDITKDSKDSIDQLIRVIKIFNCELRNRSKREGFGFLDVHELTNRGDGFSNSIWHIDKHHLSPAGMIEAWNTYYG